MCYFFNSGTKIKDSLLTRNALVMTAAVAVLATTCIARRSRPTFREPALGVGIVRTANAYTYNTPRIRRQRPDKNITWSE